MIIHQPEIIEKDNNLIVSSRIEFDKPTENFPKYIWFKISDRYKPYINTHSDPFLSVGLLAGMYFNEDIEVRGTISPKLAYYLDEYQFLLDHRMPNKVNRIEIKYNSLKSLENPGKSVGVTFSGGVDSFFAIWKHLPKNQPIKEFQISHALFIRGFDNPLNQKTNYDTYFSLFQNALQEINIELIPLETNIGSVIVTRLNFLHFMGPLLAGSGQFLGGLFKRFYIASSRDYHQLSIRASSSAPLPDKLLSTDTLDIIHHGASHRRVEKVEEIGDFETAQNYLRICSDFTPKGNILNCGKCEKCTRTLLPLYVKDKTKKFSTFNVTYKKDTNIFRLIKKFNPSGGYVPESFFFIRKHKPKLLPQLYIATAIGYVRYWLVRLIPNFVKVQSRKFGYFIHLFDKVENFENPSVISDIESSNY